MLLAEGVARAYRALLRTELGQRSYEFGEAVRGDLAPNQDGIWTVWFHRPYHVQTNSDGLRNVQPVRGEDSLRVLALGDSFTFGPYVPNEDTWAGWLETTLRRRVARGDIQVLNAGIAGYTVEDELEYYKDKGRHLRAHIVILQFHPNDITDLEVGKRQLFGRAAQSVWRRGTLRRLHRFLGDHIALYELARDVTRPVRLWFVRRALASRNLGARRDASDILYTGLRSPASLRYHDQYARAFRQLAESVRESGARLVVVAFPEYFQIPRRAYPDAPQRFLQRVAEEIGTDFVDLLAAFREAGEIDDLYLLAFEPGAEPDPRDPFFPDRTRYVGNAHLSRFGYRVAARTIADHLIEKGLVRPDRDGSTGSRPAPR